MSQNFHLNVWQQRFFLIVHETISYDLTFTAFNKISAKAGLSLSKKKCFIYFNESPLKMMKNIYFMLKVLFVLKGIKFLIWLFDHVEKTAWLER